MNTFKRSMAFIPLFFFSMAFLSESHAEPNNLDSQEKALKIIENFAERFCSIPLEGKEDKFDLSGNAKVEINMLIKKLTDLGINGAAKYQSSEWEGILQKDLANLLSKKIDCKLEVWKDLKEKIILSSTKTEKNPKVLVGDIKNNTNTQVNLNSPNSTQVVNNKRTIKERYLVENELIEDIYITHIILEQTDGIWDQGTIFKFGAKLSAPYIEYKFVRGMPRVIMNFSRQDIPEQGLIYIETTTAPLNENIIVQIKSKSPVSVVEVLAEPIE